jgi:hypothetical protein
MNTKVCKTCDIEKIIPDDFDLHYGKPRSQCKLCCRQARHSWYIARIKERGITYQSERNYKLKIEAIAAYGGACYCCGETIIEFLTLDHTNNDGKNHGKNSRSSSRLYSHLRKEGWPQDLDLRVACFNCNCGRQVNNGTVCPHQERKVIISPVRLRPGPKPKIRLRDTLDWL